MTVRCPYCGHDAALVSGDSIYPQRPDLFDLQFYLCKPCDAYVGCHGNTTKPKGTPANSELRNWRKQAHAAFDPLWKGAPRGYRNKAYKWLAGELSIPVTKCHIGMFDKRTCQRTIQAVHNYTRKNHDTV